MVVLTCKDGFCISVSLSARNNLGQGSYSDGLLAFATRPDFFHPLLQSVENRLVLWVLEIVELAHSNMVVGQGDGFVTSDLC